MAHVEKLSIALTPEMAAIIRYRLESGEYASSSEVIREALRDETETVFTAK
jgi:antitoxin ParD1/3/4